jgi:hypothetical protein
VYTISRAGHALAIGSVVLTLAFLDCADFVAPYSPTITNEVDNFEYQVPLNGVTTTARYVWTNTGNAANVNLSSAVTAGTATLTISDADAALIYAHALDASGASNTGSGTSGDWLIVVTLTNAVGTVHFTLQKP